MAKKIKEMFDVFFRAKPANLLVELRKQGKNKYGSVLAKDVNCTYSHAVKILQDMERARLVNFEKNGRIKTIELTEEGHRVAEFIEKIKEILPGPSKK
ncbi:MAG: winged helix DNA-binding protein [Nanoarchaeota archaeon]